MLQPFRNHKHLGHFILYGFTFLTYGMSIISIGPLIPYLAVETGFRQTQYSFLFSCRSFAMVAGVLFNKYLQQRQVKHHNIIILGLGLVSIFSCLFSFTIDSFWLGFWLCFASVGYALLEITVNVVLMMVNDPKELQFWMLIAHGIFGIGGLLGPYFIYAFENASFAVFGLFMAITVPFYLRYKSPELLELQHVENIGTKVNAKAVSRPLEYALCVMMFFYLGLEITFGGWISSFATLSKVTDNEGATIFPSVFWISMTFFRIFLAFVPGTSNNKLKILILANMISGVLSLMIIYAGYVELACYLSGLLFGLSMSIIYPLILVFPIEAGLALEDSQTSNIVMAGVVSEGILTMFVGWLMKWFHVNLLFYSLTFFGLAMWITRLYCLKLIDRQLKSLQENEMGVELREKVKNQQ